MELEQIGCVKTHKSVACPDIAPILHITDVLQQTNIFFLHCINLHVVEIDHTGVFWINQLVLIENVMLTEPFKHKKYRAWH